MNGVVARVVFPPLQVAVWLLEEVRIVRFAIVGASGGVIMLAMLALLVEIGGLHYLVANPICFVVAVSNNYVWNSVWTFRDRERSARGYFRYMGTSSLTLGINQSVLWFLAGACGMWYILAAICAIGTAFAFNFLLSRGWVWRRPRKEV